MKSIFHHSHFSVKVSKNRLASVWTGSAHFYNGLSFPVTMFKSLVISRLYSKCQTQTEIWNSFWNLEKFTWNLGNLNSNFKFCRSFGLVTGPSDRSSLYFSVIVTLTTGAIKYGKVSLTRERMQVWIERNHTHLVSACMCMWIIVRCSNKSCNRE